MANNVIRKAYPGAAVAAKLTAGISDSDLTFTIDSATGWPTGPTKWVVTIDRNGATEEQLLCSARSGNVVTVAERGYGDSIPLAHSSGVSAECTIDHISLDQANRVLAMFANMGEMLVFDGANLVVLGAPAADQALYSDPVTGVAWASKLIPLLSSAPAYKAGDRYFDTTRKQLMVGQGGAWLPSCPLVVVADQATRNTLLGATGTAGTMCYVTADARRYFSDGTQWVPEPKPGEWVQGFGNLTAIQASSLANGSLARDESTGLVYHKKGGTWSIASWKITVSSTAPSSPSLGDIWIQEV